MKDGGRRATNNARKSSHARRVRVAPAAAAMAAVPLPHQFSDVGRQFHSLRTFFLRLFCRHFRPRNLGFEVTTADCNFTVRKCLSRNGRISVFVYIRSPFFPCTFPFFL